MANIFGMYFVAPRAAERSSEIQNVSPILLFDVVSRIEFYWRSLRTRCMNRSWNWTSYAFACFTIFGGFSCHADHRPWWSAGQRRSLSAAPTRWAYARKQLEDQRDKKTRLKPIAASLKSRILKIPFKINHYVSKILSKHSLRFMYLIALSVSQSVNHSRYGFMKHLRHRVQMGRSGSCPCWGSRRRARPPPPNCRSPLQRTKWPTTSVTLNKTSR